MSLLLNCRFYSLGYCDVRFWCAKHRLSWTYFSNTNSEPYLLITQRFLTISTDVQRLFEEYLCPPGRRFGIIKPLTLHKSPACLKEPRCVFCSEIVKSAIDLAIEEQVSQAVDSRNASFPKTKHPSWTYGSFAKLRHVSVLEIRTAF